MVKLMKTKEIRQMSDQDLANTLKDLKTELFNLRFQNAVGQLKNTSRIRDVRKIIARVLTIADEKSRSMENSAARR